jgi:Pentapeptide repeats (9 copies)
MRTSPLVAPPPPSAMRSTAFIASAAGLSLDISPSVAAARVPPCSLRASASSTPSVPSTSSALVAAALAALLLLPTTLIPSPVNASAGAEASDSASQRTQLKVPGGSASTSGTRGMRSVIHTVTRGVNLEGADFSGQDFTGVSFQQSILRQASFARAVLPNASFFDADLSGADLSDADLSAVNFELCNLRGVDATNAVLAGAYLSSTTKFDGIKIQGSDWSDTLLRKDQQRYLCERASGTNPTTGVDTRDSLMCPLQ